MRQPVVRVIMDPSRTMITPYEIDLAKQTELTIVSGDTGSTSEAAA